MRFAIAHLTKLNPVISTEKGGTTYNLNTVLVLYTLLKNKLFLNLRHTNSSISQSKTKEDQEFG